jgi:MFS superfamily sulfate permease-like transporter
VVFERVPGTTVWWPSNPHIKGERLAGVLVVGMQAPLTFLNASTFRADLLRALQASKPELKLLVLEAASIPEIDFTAAQDLCEVLKECHQQGVSVAIARLESVRAQDAFERFRIYDVLPKDHFFHSVDQAIRALAAA